MISQEEFSQQQELMMSSGFGGEEAFEGADMSQQQQVNEDDGEADMNGDGSNF